MKFDFKKLLLFIFYISICRCQEFPKFLQTQLSNPDQSAGDANGGDSGEFLRRNQPMEHIFIPFINTLEAEYNPLFMDIKKYRKKLLEPDKGLKYKKKISDQLNSEVKNLIS